MAEEKKPESGTDDKKPEASTEELQTKVGDLEKKHSDLNQGIAKYRDEAQKYQKQAGDLETTVQELKDKIEGMKGTEVGDEVELSTEDRAKLEAWAKNQGFVTKTELAQRQSQEDITKQQELEGQAVAEFLKDNPEFDTKEDWEKIKKEFSDFYRTPTTLAGYKKILNKIVETLSGSDAERRGGDKVRAALANKSRLSLGGGSQKSGSDKNENALEDLQKKYPNLSREEIEFRLKEIDSLYEKE